MLAQVTHAIVEVTDAELALLCVAEVPTAHGAAARRVIGARALRGARMHAAPCGSNGNACMQAGEEWFGMVHAVCCTRRCDG